MTPLNHLLNYSAELAESPSFIANVSSRFVVAVSIPFEITAILENTIKLPFQAASVVVKFHAKIINLFVDSLSLKEFESDLAGPLDVIFTALKIVGYAIGVLATASLGLFYPYENFSLHYNLNLVRDHQAERQLQLSLENRQKEIAAYEKQIEERLKLLVDAMRTLTPPTTPLSPAEREEIEEFTDVPCPPIDQIILDTEQKIPTPPDVVTEDNLPIEQTEIKPVNEQETPLTQNEIATPKEEAAEILVSPSHTEEQSPVEDLNTSNEQRLLQPIIQAEDPVIEDSLLNNLDSTEIEEDTQPIDSKDIEFDTCDELVNTESL